MTTDKDDINMIKVICLVVRQVKVIMYAIKHNIPPNDIRCNMLLERLIVKQQQCLSNMNLKPSNESFMMLNIVRKQLYG
jgi:hypothetical protein